MCSWLMTAVSELRQEASDSEYDSAVQSHSEIEIKLICNKVPHTNLTSFVCVFSPDEAQKPSDPPRIYRQLKTGVK